MRWMVGIAVLVAALNAGCADSPDATVPVTEHAGHDGAGLENATSPNQPPLVTFTPSAINGTAPVNVTFRFDATDPEGDDMTWRLDFGDGNKTSGDALPATITHNFTANGTFEIALTVSDGQNESVATRTLTVLAGAPAVVREPIVETFTNAFGCELCTQMASASFCAGFNAGESGAECGWITLPPEAVGRTFFVTATSPSPVPDDPTGTFTLNGANPDVQILASCAPDAASLLFLDGTGDETGVVPEGAGCLVAWDYDETWVNIKFDILIL